MITLPASHYCLEKNGNLQFFLHSYPELTLHRPEILLISSNSYEPRPSNRAHCASSDNIYTWQLSALHAKSNIFISSKAWSFCIIDPNDHWQQIGNSWYSFCTNAASITTFKTKKQISVAQCFYINRTHARRKKDKDLHYEDESCWCGTRVSLFTSIQHRPDTNMLHKLVNIASYEPWPVAEENTHMEIRRKL